MICNLRLIGILWVLDTLYPTLCECHNIITYQSRYDSTRNLFWGEELGYITAQRERERERERERLNRSGHVPYSTGLRGTQYASLCISSGSFHILQGVFHIPEFACIFCRPLSSLCMAFAESIVRAIHIILCGLHSVGLFSDYEWLFSNHEWLLLRKNMARAIHKFLREPIQKSPP